MKLAIIGSRNLVVEDLEKYFPTHPDEIVSGGASGIDTCAREFAKSRGIPLKEFLPQYGRYGKSAPLKRNDEIIAYADSVLAFWDGKSRGTQYVIERCLELHIPIKVIYIQP